MLFLKQALILPFLCHKSATTCQIDSYEVSNSKLRLDLCNCVKTEMIESTAPPQYLYKRSTLFGTRSRMQNVVKINLFPSSSQRKEYEEILFS